MTVETVVIVGSGASGVALALSLLERGRKVLMLDVGREVVRADHPDLAFPAWRRSLADPAETLLGRSGEALVLPDHDGEYYGFPPAKKIIFEGLEGFDWVADGFAPLLSFARGGLAEAWTGGSYAFTPEELEGFPFPADEMGEAYEAVASEIGISGAEDDLSEVFPHPAHPLPPVEADAHTTRLLARYDLARETLRRKESCVLGRARLAVLTRDRGERKACTRLGRCLWGCPRGALYTPSWGLARCQERDGFTYRPGIRVLRIEATDGGDVRRLHLRPVDGGADEVLEVETVVLAAGTLATADIVLRSLAGVGVDRLPGLMDNRQVLVPFVSPGRLGKGFEPESYQYHQLAMVIEPGGGARQIHALITTLKTAMIHPVVQSLPIGLKGALRLFRDLHGALGLVNVNFADERRDESFVALEDLGGTATLRVHYEPPPLERTRLPAGLRRVRRVLRRLGAFAPRSMAHVRPMGASVHYAGTLPYSANGGDLTLDAAGRLRPFRNLYVADGSALPSLPSKNLTYTLMANAWRVGRLLGD